MNGFAGQKTPLVLASYSGGKFSGLPQGRDLQFMPNAGIMLSKVTLTDTGLYKVEITIYGHQQLFKQFAFLNVSGM